MVFPAWFTSIVAALGLSACTVSLPASGPGLDGLSRDLPADTEVVVVITHVTLEQDTAAQSRFWAANGRVADSMSEMPGLITHALRREIFGNQGWTLTVWEDAASVNAFMRSGTHARAMEAAAGTFADARFARIRMPVSDVPRDWDAALALLEADARHYYE